MEFPKINQPTHLAGGMIYTPRVISSSPLDFNVNKLARAVPAPLLSAFEFMLIPDLSFLVLKGLLDSSDACIRELSESITETPDKDEKDADPYANSPIQTALRWHLSLFNFYDRLLQPLLNRKPVEALDADDPEEIEDDHIKQH